LARASSGDPQRSKLRVESSAAAPPDGGLPTRQVVVLDWPRPPVGLVTIVARLRAPASSTAMPSTCPSIGPQRSPTVKSGQPPCPLSYPSSRQRVRRGCFPSSRSGPHRVRTASGTAGPRRSQAVTVGERQSQVTRHPPPRPWTAKQPAAGFESHLTAAASAPLL
jgi:hypothetical protein